MPSVFFLIIVLLLILIICLCVWIFKSPFTYPYQYFIFDVSGKRKPKIEDLIDKYLNEHGMETILEYYEYVEEWKTECQNRISKGILKKKRKQQFLSCLDDDAMFQFIATRSQTRYRQQNYVRSPYHVEIEVGRFTCNISYLEQRYRELEKIGFECTLSEYHAKNQRKLMTKTLREEIALRDNYTCQICGKYMPDGVGLHIDHIIPIAKGGKTVPSNLQVLCSKCNGKKFKN